MVWILRHCPVRRVLHMNALCNLWRWIINLLNTASVAMFQTEFSFLTKKTNHDIPNSSRNLQDFATIQRIIYTRRWLGKLEIYSKHDFTAWIQHFYWKQILCINIPRFLSIYLFLLGFPISVNVMDCFCSLNLCHKTATCWKI